MCKEVETASRPGIMTARDTVPTENTDKKQSPTNAGDDHGASTASKMLDEAGRFGKALTGSLLYSAIQSPITGAAQVLDQVASTHTADALNFISKPGEAKFGSVEWHAQQFGSGLGIAADFYVTTKLLGKSGKSLAGESAEAVQTVEAVSTSKAIMKSAVSGAVFQGVFTPTSNQNENFWQNRLESAGSGAATFATLTGTSIGLRSVIKPAGVGSSFLSKVVKSDAALGFAAGVPAGIVSAQTGSIFHGQGLASVEQSVQSAYGFSVAGGPLGLAHALGGKAEGKIPEADRVEATPTRVSPSEHDVSLRQSQIIGKSTSAIDATNSFLPHDTGSSTTFRLESFLPGAADHLATAARDIAEVLKPESSQSSDAVLAPSVLEKANIGHYNEFDRMALNPELLDLTRDFSPEISSSKRRTLYLDRYSPTGETVTEKVSARIITLGSRKTEIVIPDATENGAMQTRAWRTWAATLSGEQRDEFDFLMSTSGDRIGIPSDGTKRNDYLHQILPEQLGPFLDELPDSDLIRRVVLWPDGGGNAAADAGGRDINLYNFHNIEFSFMRTLMFHEWAHIAENAVPAEATPFYSAAALEKNGYYASNYSRTNTRENIAVHLGEEMLAPDADNFFALASQAPLRTVALAEMMRPALLRAEANGSTSVFHNEFVSRLNFVDTDVVPHARAALGRELGMDFEQSADALQFLRDINKSNPDLAFRLADIPQIEQLAGRRLDYVDARGLNDLISTAQSRVALDLHVDNSYNENLAISGNALEEMSKAPADSALGQALRESMHYRLNAGGDDARGALDWLYSHGHQKEAATEYAPPQVLERLIHDDNWSVAADALAIYLSPSYISAVGRNFQPMTHEIYEEAQIILKKTDDVSGSHLLNALASRDNLWNQPISPEISNLISDAMYVPTRKQTFMTALTLAAENSNVPLKLMGMEVAAETFVRGKFKVETFQQILAKGLKGVYDAERQQIATTVLRVFPRNDRGLIVDALRQAGLNGADLRSFERAVTAIPF